MSRSVSLIRRLSLIGLALCLGILGPAVLAGIPSALNLGSEEETRCAVTHVIGGSLSARQRPPAPTGRPDRERRRHAGEGRRSLRRREARPPAMSLCAMRVRLQV